MQQSRSGTSSVRQAAKENSDIEGLAGQRVGERVLRAGNPLVGDLGEASLLELDLGQVVAQVCLAAGPGTTCLIDDQLRVGEYLDLGRPELCTVEETGDHR